MALHHYLLSLPPGWRIGTIDDIAQAVFPLDSRERMRRAAKELRDAGLLILHTKQDERGRWSKRYQVFHNPQPAAQSDATERRKTGVRSDQGKREFPQVAPNAVKPAFGKTAVNKKTDAEDSKKTGFDLPAVGTSTPVSAPDPAIADKDKTLEAFATGKLARARSDIPDQRPAARRFTDLCQRCTSTGHPAENCPTLREHLDEPRSLAQLLPAIAA
jgi:hypothetical protein